MRKSTLAIIACALVCASASAQTSPNQQDQQTQDPQDPNSQDQKPRSKSAGRTVDDTAINAATNSPCANPTRHSCANASNENSAG